ncbi:MAG: hypothetical protein QE271_08355 [Bacteriovoracaceae bacterium]|nr:hypothetical protein [Bacteriovoracaceae bacterium]
MKFHLLALILFFAFFPRVYGEEIKVLNPNETRIDFSTISPSGSTNNGAAIFLVNENSVVVRAQSTFDKKWNSLSFNFNDPFENIKFTNIENLNSKKRCVVENKVNTGSEYIIEENCEIVLSEPIKVSISIFHIARENKGSRRLSVKVINYSYLENGKVYKYESKYDYIEKRQ